jgi:hypothetical protein
MAKIVDPDFLIQNTEIVISTAGKTIQLVATGNLSAASPAAVNGVTGQAVYSALKEFWKDDDALNKFKFPLFMYTKTDGTLQNGWGWADDTTRSLIRDFGWAEGASAYAGMATLGDVAADADQAYYVQSPLYDATTTNFQFTGELNEAVDITGNTTYIKAFLRIQGKTFAEYDLVNEQNLSLLEPILYKFPFSNATDINITETDGNIGTLSPYTGMKVNYLAGSGFTTAAAQSYSVGDVVQDGAGRWAYCSSAGTLDAAGAADYTANGGTGTFEAYDGEIQIGADYYAFNRIIDANNGTTEELYNWMQYQLRQATDINANDSTTVGQRSGLTMNGKNAERLGFFVGSNLNTYGGVGVVNLNTNSINDITLGTIDVDGGGVDATTYLPVAWTGQGYPFTAAGTLEFSANLVGEPDADTRYTMYYTTNPTGNFDSSTAVIVQENDLLTDIDGTITSASIAWDYNYDNNEQGGRTKGTDAAVTVVAQGLNDAQWVEVTHTITRTTGQTINVNALDERNYDNPA